jgi:hypothetical protein
MAAAAAESNIVKKLPPGVEEVKAPLGTETHYYKDGVFYIPIPGGGYRKWSPA